MQDIERLDGFFPSVTRAKRDKLRKSSNIRTARRSSVGNVSRSPVDVEEDSGVV